MRSANSCAAPALLAATLAGCGVTLPWTDESSSPAGRGALTVSPAALTFHGQAGEATSAAKRLAWPSARNRRTSAWHSTARLRTQCSSSTPRARRTWTCPCARPKRPASVTITGCADESAPRRSRGARSCAGHVQSHVYRCSDGVRGLSHDARAPAGGRRCGPAPQTVALSQRCGGTSAWYTCIETWNTPLTWLSFTPGIGRGAASDGRGDGARRRAPGGHDALGAFLLPDRALHPAGEALPRFPASATMGLNRQAGDAAGYLSAPYSLGILSETVQLYVLSLHLECWFATLPQARCRCSRAVRRCPFSGRRRYC
jgi:hypothetical protein